MLGGAIGNLTVAYFAAGTPLVVQGHVITTTAEHPFYVAGEERFVPAGELTLEDQLVDSQGRPIAIDAIRVTDRLITVYNLRVADFHTYFVGGKLWQFDAWVHNAGQIKYDGGVKAPSSVMSEADRLRIQRFADKYDTEVHVVGSRAKGTAGPDSDYDYILGEAGGNSRLRQKARQELPRGTAGGEVHPSHGETGIDVFKEPLDRTRPHITIRPNRPGE